MKIMSKSSVWLKLAGTVRSHALSQKDVVEDQENKNKLPPSIFRLQRKKEEDLKKLDKKVRSAIRTKKKHLKLWHHKQNL